MSVGQERVLWLGNRLGWGGDTSLWRGRLFVRSAFIPRSLAHGEWPGAIPDYPANRPSPQRDEWRRSEPIHACDVATRAAA